MVESLQQTYYNWLCALAFPDEFLRNSYSNLLYILHKISFRWSLRMDENRQIDGLDLRYKFGSINNIPDYIVKEQIDFVECSVLEMMMALAYKCEDEIMCDPREGDRTQIWFQEMIKNLGLDHYQNQNWTRSSEAEVIHVINLFLDRRYSPNGQGGLFVVNDPKTDMRTVDIWYQMSWYIASISQRIK